MRRRDSLFDRQVRIHITDEQRRAASGLDIFGAILVGAAFFFFIGWAMFGQ